MREEDPDELADQLEHEADQLERHSREVQQEADRVRQDWERKRRDESVPGAPPPGADEEDTATEPDGDR